MLWTYIYVMDVYFGNTHSIYIYRMSVPKVNVHNFGSTLSISVL